jgi:DNA repair protein RadC
MPAMMESVPPDDRPREKLDRVGVAALGDNELLALVLGHGHERLGALELANLVLKTIGGVPGLTRVRAPELRGVRGIGHAKAATILAAVELGRRTLLRVPRLREQLATPADAARFLMPQYGSGGVEQFGLILLDTKHRVLRTAIVSVGTVDTSVVHPREVFREAATGGAAAILLFHNHPSGDPAPSPDDLRLTRRMMAAGQVMGIDVLDHIILGDRVYWSFKEAIRTNAALGTET